MARNPTLIFFLKFVYQKLGYPHSVGYSGFKPNQVYFIKFNCYYVNTNNAHSISSAMIDVQFQQLK